MLTIFYTQIYFFTSLVIKLDKCYNIGMKNYHTHTKRCGHATGSDASYVKAAIKAGYTELGFSDHSPMLFPNPDEYYSNFRMKIDDCEDYVKSIRALQQEYKNEIKIFFGFELEYYPELFEKTEKHLAQYNYDYLILGQHFVGNEYEEGATYNGSDSDNPLIFDRYINQTLEGLATGKFLYLAHPDLFKWTGDDKTYITKMTYFCKEIKRLGYPIEFNMLGFFENRNYPDKRFWKIAAEVGNDVIIGIDAHTPTALRRKLTLRMAQKYLSDLGIIPLDGIKIK